MLLRFSLSKSLNTCFLNLCFMSLIANRVRVCRSIWAQGTGLMFRWPKGNFAFVFPFAKPRKIAITMWFVFYPIDIVFLDKQGIVVELVSNLKPFSSYKASQAASSFIEFSAGTISRHNLKRGMCLRWSDDSVKSCSNSRT